MTTPDLTVDTDGPATIHPNGMPGYTVPTSTSWNIATAGWEAPCDCGSGLLVPWRQTLGLRPSPQLRCPECPDEGATP